MRGSAITGLIFKNGQDGDFIETEEAKQLLALLEADLVAKPNQRFRIFCLVEIQMLKNIFGL